MAYGLKYILRYETDRTKSDFQIFIYEDLWTGGAAYKKIGASHVRMSKSKDKKVCGTSLEFSIQADTDFEYTNFFSGNNKRHKVELYFGDPAHAQLYWTGFIVSDQYSEAYVAPPYDVEVLCTDGLGLLKTEDFELTGMQSRFDAIRYILDKISLGDGYYVNVDLFETTMSATNHNTMAQLHYQTEIHSGKNCYDVLQSLLPEDTTIVQANNRWLIERAADIGKTRYKYNPDGTGELAEYTFDTLQLGTIASADVFPIGNLTMEFTPAWKNFVIKQTFGKRDSLLRNYNFKAGTDSWTENGATGFLKAVNMEAGSYGIVTGRQIALTKSVSQAIQLNSWSPIILEVKYAPIGYYRRTGTTSIQPFLVDVFFKVVLSATFSGSNWYFTEAGWLPETAAADNKFIKIKGVETSQFYDDMKLQETKITASKLPEDGLLTVYIYQTRLADNADYHFSGLAVKYVNIYSQDLTLFSDKAETKVNITENATLEGDTVDLLPCDLPDYQYAELYFDNGNYLRTGDIYRPAKLWSTSAVRYIEYLASYMANQYAVPKTILKGQISGFLTGFDRIIQHTLNDNKKFNTVTGTWNIIEETMDVELEEIITFDEVITVEVPEEFNPRLEYERHPELDGFVSIDPAIDLDWIRSSEGSYNHTLPGTNVPVVVYKKESIAPYQLDFDSGTPQFSLKSAFFTPNYTDDVNLLRVDSGSLISHNFNSKTRAEIDFIKNDSDDYDPTREWSIAAETITLPNNNAHFIYAVAPLDPDETAAGIMVSEDHIEPKATEGYITFKLGLASSTDGITLRDLALLWGNGKPKDISRVQSDWTQTDDTEPDYIKHKPNYSVQALSGTAVTWDANSGMNARLTLSGNTTINLSNLVAGTSGNLTIINPSTVYTLTFAGYTNKISPSVYSAANVVTTSGSSKIDMYSWYYDGTYLVWNGSQDYK